MLKTMSKIWLPLLLVLLASCGKLPNTVGGSEIGAASCRYVDVSSLKQKVTLDVPYVEQLPNYCGPASLEMIYSYYGTDIDQKEIGSGIIGPQGVAADQLAQVSLDMGYDVTKEYCGMNDLLASLDNGNPVLVRVINNSGTNGHFMVVTGYDMQEKVIYINDPSSSRNDEMSFQDFDSIWNITTLPAGNNSSRLMIIIVPKGSN